MMRYLVGAALILAGCSHAENSATTPRPAVIYVADTTAETEASEQAVRFCRYYNAEPAVPADGSGAMPRFECTGPARAGRSFFMESLGF
jgi:hypothetical protein